MSVLKLNSCSIHFQMLYLKKSAMTRKITCWLLKKKYNNQMWVDISLKLADDEFSTLLI